jgi:hypothetical protein
LAFPRFRFSHTRFNYPMINHPGANAPPLLIEEGSFSGGSPPESKGLRASEGGGFMCAIRSAR